MFDAGAAARAADGEGVLRACAREALFAPAVLYVDVEDEAELRLAERLEAAAVVIGGPRRNAPRRRTPVRFDVAKPSGEEQRALWRAALGADDELDALVEHFDLSAGEIAAAAARAAADRGTPGAAWQATLRSTRPRLGTWPRGSSPTRAGPPWCCPMRWWARCARSSRRCATARGPRRLGLRRTGRARARRGGALRRRQRHRQDDGRRGARRASSASTSTASTWRAW